MLNLEKFQARVCYTACAFVIHQAKILLVKHKKIGLWLAPGGHRKLQELPHQTAMRECTEETGIKSKVVSALPQRPGLSSQYLPVPFAINLHWISQENYQARTKSPSPQKPHRTKIWPKGCEQHVVYCYLHTLQGSSAIVHNHQETDAAGWFSPSQVKNLDTSEDIKQEITHAFKLHHHLRPSSNP